MLNQQSFSTFLQHVKLSARQNGSAFFYPWQWVPEKEILKAASQREQLFIGRPVPFSSWDQQYAGAHWERQNKREKDSKEELPSGKSGDPENMTGHSVRRWRSDCCRPGSSPVDQQREAQPAAGFGLLVA